MPNPRTEYDKRNGSKPTTQQSESRNQSNYQPTQAMPNIRHNAGGNYRTPNNTYRPPASGAHSAYVAPVGAHAQAAQGKKGKKALWITLACVLAVILGTGIALAAYFGVIQNQLNRGDKSDAELMAIDSTLGGYQSNFNEPFYMLLLGSDARPGETVSRTDTNILVRVDPVEYKVSMLSIPRDTKIEIPGHGTQKFNAAYAFDQVPGVIEATEDLLDVDVSHYAQVDFTSLKDLVDAVGGVTVEVDNRIDDYHCDDGDGNHYVIEKGTQELNGGQALTFARSRAYAQGDFTRTSNQRKLVEAIIEEVLKAPITSIPGIINAAADTVTTDIRISDIVSLAQQFAGQKDIVMYSAMLPSYTQNINGISFVINDEEKTAEMMEKFINGEDPSGIVSDKSAADINTSSINTSNVLLFDDDDEVANGSANATSKDVVSGNSSASPSTPSTNTSNASNTTNSTNTGNTTNTGGSQTGGNTSAPPPETDPEEPGGQVPTEPDPADMSGLELQGAGVAGLSGAGPLSGTEPAGLSD